MADTALSGNRHKVISHQVVLSQSRKGPPVKNCIDRGYHPSDTATGPRWAARFRPPLRRPDTPPFIIGGWVQEHARTGAYVLAYHGAGMRRVKPRSRPAMGACPGLRTHDVIDKTDG